MAAKKLSEITQGTPTSNDFVVGVTAANQDRLFSTTSLGKRNQLAGSTNFYVSTTGSDSNDGSSATQVPGTLHGPFATLQHADDTIAINTDLNGFDVVVNIAAGTYVGIANQTGYFSSLGPRNFANVVNNITYLGDSVTPTNVKVTANPLSANCFGQFAANSGGNTGVILDGWDFLANVDSAVWCENFYVGTPLVAVGIQNCQFDACGQGVSLTAGNVNAQGNITLNGAAAGWIGGSQHCTAFQNTNNEIDQGNRFFSEANVTISGNPAIDFLLSVAGISSAEFTGGGVFTGAYTGAPFVITQHSTLTSPFLTWTNSKWGTPTAKPVINLGGLSVVITGVLGLEATGGQLIGQNQNYSQPVTGFTLTLGIYDGVVIIDPAGTLATGTINMPSPVIDQQRITIRSSQIITTLTVSPGAGQAVAGAPTTIAAGGVIDALYRDANATWYF